MFSCRQNAFLLSPDSRQERTTRSICSSVCFMITVFHKAKHKLPSCKDVLARVLTLHQPLGGGVAFPIFQQELRRGEIPKGTVRSLVVVNPHPCLRCQASLVQTIKGEHVQHLVAVCSIKAFDVAILMRLALLNEY